MEMGPVPKVDVLSNLPGNLIDAILVRLPIKDAVRTSILSHKWINKWTTIPELVFNEECIPHPSGDTEFDQFYPVAIVDQVFLRHIGPIHKFECSGFLKSCSYIDLWIRVLSKHGIEEFTLDCLEGELYKPPSSLFSFQDMTFLKLTNCIITPPPTFNGFHKLTSVYLANTSTNEHLLSNCPLLERLTWINFLTPKHLKICSPNLRELTIHGIFSSLCIEDTPLLAIVKINLDFSIDNATGQLEQDGSCNLVKVLGSLHCIQTLEIRGQFLHFLAIGKVPERLTTSYDHLRHLYLCMNFNASKEILSALCLFRSSPNLERLEIEACPKRGADDMLGAREILGNAQECFLTRLTVVEMFEITGAKLEMEFAKFILANAPVLCLLNLEIREKTDDEELGILKELSQFPIASTRASISIR